VVSTTATHVEDIHYLHSHTFSTHFILMWEWTVRLPHAELARSTDGLVATSSMRARSFQRGMVIQVVSEEQRPSSNTPTVFSREEAEQVRAMAKNPDATLLCPRCDEALTVGPTVSHQRRGKRYMIRALTCPVCHRCLSIKDTEIR